jgi:exo beta-1,2-glucooligosaccharide sophorohydrolase (non-reducing end)
MKIRLQLLLVLLIATIASIGQEPLYDFVVFSNSRMNGNYFFSNSVFSAPSFVSNTSNKLPVSETIFHTPGNAIRLEFINGKKGNWKAGIFKQNFRGQDHFKKAAFLSFWYHITSSVTTAKQLPTIQLMYQDSSLSETIAIEESTRNKWIQKKFPLEAFSKLSSEDPSTVLGIIFSQAAEDGNRHTMFVDDIEYVTGEAVAEIITPPTDITAVGYAKHVDLKWPAITDSSIRYVKIYRSKDGKIYQPVGIQVRAINRYADYVPATGVSFYYRLSFLTSDYRESPQSPAVITRTKKMTDDQLLTMVQEASFRYYWEGAEVNSGLTKENISGRQNMIASGASGFGMMALIAGTERKFITRAQAVQRFLKIVSFLEKAETFHGVFSHFIDGPTGKVEPFFGKRDNGGDLVETSFLLQGLLTARAYFNKNDADEQMIREKITTIWNKVEWDWYKQYPDSKFLYWHWSPDQAFVINHNLIGWNETMVTYLLAIASPTHGIDASMYYSGWANQDSTGQQYRINWGGTKEGSMYKNGNTYFGIKLDAGVSNGGPLFFTHYSYLGYDPHAITDKYTNYFKNNKNIALINHHYCVQNPGKYKGYGDSCWGLTASDGPYHYSANEPVLRQDKGIMAPTGAISSFPYTPKESMKALKNYYYNYGKFLWGEYGFRDAFSLTDNWCSEIYMGLNQAPMTVMIENYRTGLLWKLFMSNADVQNGLKKLREVE